MMPITEQILPDLKQLETLVRKAAKEELLSQFGHAEYHYKDDGSVVTPADFAMQERLKQELLLLWPQYALLGEEMSEPQQRAVLESHVAYWCIDPLDGTSNFAAGLPLFAVSIALIINHQQQLGLIYDPLRDEMFTAIKGQGAWLNGNRLSYRQSDTSSTGQKDKHIVAEIDIKRLPRALSIKLIENDLFISQRNLGAATLEWCWLAANRFDLYLKGAQKLWDYAAGSLIFAEAGGYALSLDNQPVFKEQLGSRSVLAALDEDLFKHWYNWLDIPVKG